MGALLGASTWVEHALSIEEHMENVRDPSPCSTGCRQLPGIKTKEGMCDGLRSLILCFANGGRLCQQFQCRLPLARLVLVPEQTHQPQRSCCAVCPSATPNHVRKDRGLLSFQVSFARGGKLNVLCGSLIQLNWPLLVGQKLRCRVARDAFARQVCGSP
eukprot:2335053-Amphidinium_carterae.1